MTPSITPIVCIQSHHDHCTNLPPAVERDFHQLVGIAACEQASCEIGRAFEASLGSCPQPACDSMATQLAAVQTLADNSCDLDCSSSSCGDAFKIVRAAHDGCSEDEVAEAVETEIHSYEEACQLQECNVGNSTSDPNLCVDSGDEDHHQDLHGHAESCGCEAAELGFRIDCSNGSFVESALQAALQQCNNQSCADYSSQCHRNYIIVQVWLVFWEDEEGEEGEEGKAA